MQSANVRVKIRISLPGPSAMSGSGFVPPSDNLDGPEVEDVLDTLARLNISEHLAGRSVVHNSTDGNVYADCE